MLKAHPFKAVGMLQLYCYVERDRVSIKKKDMSMSKHAPNRPKYH